MKDIVSGEDSCPTCKGKGFPVKGSKVYSPNRAQEFETAATNHKDMMNLVVGEKGRYGQGCIACGGSGRIFEA